MIIYIHEIFIKSSTTAFSQKVQEMVNRVYWIVYSTYEHNGITTLSIPLMNQITWTIHFLSRHYHYLTHSSIVRILKIINTTKKIMRIIWIMKKYQNRVKVDEYGTLFKELGPRTAKLALSICLKMKMVEYVWKRLN